MSTQIKSFHLTFYFVFITNLEKHTILYYLFANFNTTFLTSDANDYTYFVIFAFCGSFAII